MEIVDVLAEKQQITKPSVLDRFLLAAWTLVYMTLLFVFKQAKRAETASEAGNRSKDQSREPRG